MGWQAISGWPLRTRGRAAQSSLSSRTWTPSEANSPDGGPSAADSSDRRNTVTIDEEIVAAGQLARRWLWSRRPSRWWCVAARSPSTRRCTRS